MQILTSPDNINSWYFRYSPELEGYTIRYTDYNEVLYFSIKPELDLYEQLSDDELLDIDLESLESQFTVARYDKLVQQFEEELVIPIALQQPLLKSCELTGYDPDTNRLNYWLFNYLATKF
jgi:hypothetical protein